MASKTYKQWADFHYKKLKKQNPGISESILKVMAGDAAKRSFDAQQSANASAQSALSDRPEALTTTRVGPQAPTMPIPGKGNKAPTPNQAPATPTLTPLSSMIPPGGASYNDRIQQRLKATNSVAPTLYPRFSPIEVTGNVTTGLAAPDFLKTLTDSDYRRIKAVLKEMNYRVAADKGAVNKLLTENFSELFPVQTADALIKKLSERVIGGGGGAEQLPQRQIQKVDRQTLADFAQGIADEFMFQLDPDRLKKVVDTWEKKANRGVVTTTKKVRNPKTGKLEQVTTTTRGFQQATEGEKLREQIKQESPQQVELAQGISFIDELKNILSGGM